MVVIFLLIFSLLALLMVITTMMMMMSKMSMVLKMLLKANVSHSFSRVDCCCYFLVDLFVVGFADGDDIKDDDGDNNDEDDDNNEDDVKDVKMLLKASVSHSLSRVFFLLLLFSH